MPTLLLSRPDRVGDVIIATACLEPIRRQWPDWRIVFAAREVMRPLLEGHPLIDEFLPLPGPGPGRRRRALEAAFGRGPLAAAIRQTGADAAVHLHPDDACQLAARSADIPRRIGYRQGALLTRWTLTDPHADTRREGALHESQYNFALLDPLGIEAPPLAGLRPSVHLDPRCRETLRAKLTAAGWSPPWPRGIGCAADTSGNRQLAVLASSHPQPAADATGTQRPAASDSGHDQPAPADASSDYLVLNPTAFSLSLRWPAERFASLARSLRAEFGRVVLVAERADDPSVVEIRRQLADATGRGAGGWFLDLAGQTDLAELGWLLRHARLLISRNTGTAHLASAVGCPLVELFGRLEGIYGPGRWRALGEKTRVVTAAAGLLRGRGESKQAYWRRCHAAIPEDEVLAAARELVSEAPHSPTLECEARD